MKIFFIVLIISEKNFYYLHFLFKKHKKNSRFPLNKDTKKEEKRKIFASLFKKGDK